MLAQELAGSTMRNIMAHHMNSVHVYCRLLDLGLKKELALKLSLTWEKIFHNVLYAGHC